MKHKIIPENFQTGNAVEKTYYYSLYAKATTRIIIDTPPGLQFSHLTANEMLDSERSLREVYGTELVNKKDCLEILVKKNHTYYITYKGTLPYADVECYVERKVKRKDKFKITVSDISADLSFVFNNTRDMLFQNMALTLYRGKEACETQPVDINYGSDGRLSIYYSNMPAGAYTLEIEQSNNVNDTTFRYGESVMMCKNHMVRDALRCGYKLKRLPNGNYGLHDYVFNYAARLLEGVYGD